jgi:hypothetical protein
MWSLKEKPVVNSFSQRWPQSHILQPDPPRDFSECRLGLTQLATEVLAVIALRDAAKPKITRSAEVSANSHQGPDLAGRRRQRRMR